MEGGLTLQEVGESGVRVCGQVWEEELAADWTWANLGEPQRPWVCGGLGGGSLRASCWLLEFSFLMGKAGSEGDLLRDQAVVGEAIGS